MFSTKKSRKDNNFFPPIPDDLFSATFSYAPSYELYNQWRLVSYAAKIEADLTLLSRHDEASLPYQRLLLEMLISSPYVFKSKHDKYESSEDKKRLTSQLIQFVNHSSLLNEDDILTGLLAIHLLLKGPFLLNNEVFDLGLLKLDSSHFSHEELKHLLERSTHEQRNEVIHRYGLKLSDRAILYNLDAFIIVLPYLDSQQITFFYEILYTNLSNDNISLRSNTALFLKYLAPMVSQEQLDTLYPVLTDTTGYYDYDKNPKVVNCFWNLTSIANRLDDRRFAALLSGFNQIKLDDYEDSAEEHLTELVNNLTNDRFNLLWNTVTFDLSPDETLFKTISLLLPRTCEEQMNAFLVKMEPILKNQTDLDLLHTIYPSLIRCVIQKNNNKMKRLLNNIEALLDNHSEEVRHAGYHYLKIYCKESAQRTADKEVSMSFQKAFQLFINSDDDENLPDFDFNMVNTISYLASLLNTDEFNLLCSRLQTQLNDKNAPKYQLAQAIMTQMIVHIDTDHFTTIMPYIDEKLQAARSTLTSNLIDALSVYAHRATTHQAIHILPDLLRWLGDKDLNDVKSLLNAVAVLAPQVNKQLTSHALHAVIAILNQYDTDLIVIHLALKAIASLAPKINDDDFLNAWPLVTETVLKFSTSGDIVDYGLKAFTALSFKANDEQLIQVTQLLLTHERISVFHLDNVSRAMEIITSQINKKRIPNIRQLFRTFIDPDKITTQVLVHNMTLLEAYAADEQLHCSLKLINEQEDSFFKQSFNYVACKPTNSVDNFNTHKGIKSLLLQLRENPNPAFEGILAPVASFIKKVNNTSCNIINQLVLDIRDELLSSSKQFNPSNRKAGEY